MTRDTREIAREVADRIDTEFRVCAGCEEMAAMEEMIAAAIEQDRAEREAWLPIESAPKREPVLVAFQSGERQVCYQTGNGPPFMETWRYAGPLNRGQQAPWPTHWRPLPSPPSEESSS